MKSFLHLIFLFAFQFVFSQSLQCKQDSTNIQNKTSESMIVIIDKENATKEKFKLNTEKSNVAQNINIVQEINTVLNYRVNRIWRQDLYCLVCMKNYNSERAA